MSPLEKYIRMLKRLGFRQVLEIPFTMPGDRSEKFFVFYHKRDAVLLAFETFLGAGVKAGNFYYNWKRRVRDGTVYKRKLLCEGHWSSRGSRNIFVGSHYLPAHDVRAVLCRFRNNGTFVTPWIEGQRVHFAHSGDSHDEYDRVTAERIKLLPEQVRKMFLL